VAASQERTLRAQLDEADALLDVVFARAPVGLAFFDDELRYVRVNERLAAMNGLPAAAHLGRRVGEVLPDMPRDVEDDLRRVLHTGEPLVEVEVSGLTRASKGRREWLASYWPVRPAGADAITGIGAVVFDVTDRRIARRAIRAQADRYEALLIALSEAGEGMVVVEEDGHCVYANAAFEQISGYTFPELATLESLVELTRPAALDGCDWVEGAGLLALRRRDGTTVDVEAAGVPLESDQGRHLVVLVRDVTARLRDEAEREQLLTRAALTAEATEVLGAAGDEAQTLDALARLCVRELGDTCVAVLGDEPGGVRRTTVATRDPARESALVELQLRYPLDEEPHRAIGEVLRTGVTRVIDDLGDEHIRAIAVDDRHLELLRALAVRSAFLVPMRARHGVCGVLAVGVADPAPDAREMLVGALEDLGRLGALALESARLTEERAASARTLQRSLLPPRLPEIPGIELAARHRPADEGAEVGGDFYDCFDAGGGEWAVAIGDVSGRGAEAAAVATLARCTLRAAVLTNRHPEAVLRELNDAVVGQGREYRFCTALYVSLCPRADGADLRLAGGGHPLPLIVRARGTVETAGRTGTLLGVVPDPDLGTAEVHLGAGDVIVLVTDGAAPGDLGGFLRDYAGRDADTIAGAIEDRAIAAGGGRLRDDAAVVVLRAAV
jgi:PAS domain-containing protein